MTKRDKKESSPQQETLDSKEEILKLSESEIEIQPGILWNSAKLIELSTPARERPDTNWMVVDGKTGEELIVTVVGGFAGWITEDGNFPEYGNLRVKSSPVSRLSWQDRQPSSAYWQFLIDGGGTSVLGEVIRDSKEFEDKIRRDPIIGFEHLKYYSPSENPGQIKLVVPVCAPKAAFPGRKPPVDTAKQSELDKVVAEQLSNGKYCFCSAEASDAVPGSYMPVLRQRTVVDGKSYYTKLELRDLEQGDMITVQFCCIPFVNMPYDAQGSRKGSQGNVVIRYRLESLVRHNVAPVIEARPTKRIRSMPISAPPASK